MKKWDAQQILLYVTIVTVTSFTLGVTLLFNYANQKRLSTSSFAADSDISLEPYCQDGYYNIPGEPRCSRAPNCGGYGYDELNTTDKMPNPQSCMGDGSGRNDKGCAGYVPVCCYEMARTGRYTKCIGYWERIWCTKPQCDQAAANGASNSECGGDCGDCGHAFKTYCGPDKQAVPLAQRLGIGAPPTATNTQAPPPTSTFTPRPIQPTATFTPTTAPNQPTQRPTAPMATFTPVPTAPPGNVPTTVKQPTVVKPTSSGGVVIVTLTPTPASIGENPFVPPVSTNTPIAVQPSSSETNSAPQPTIDIKTPKELAREVVTYERVDQLNKQTELPLTAIKTGYTTIKTYDAQLENTVERWIFRIRMEIQKMIQKLQ